MNYIKSKDICFLIRDTLKLIDRNMVIRGERIAYIFYQMLKSKGILEDYELAEYTFLGIIHNIGTLKTGAMRDTFKGEEVEGIPHSIFGYLFMKYLSPFTKENKILLYHHVNYVNMKKIEYEETWVSDYLHLAYNIESFLRIQGKDFDYTMFERYVGKRFSKEAYEMLVEAVKRDDIFYNIKNGSYLGELNVIMGDLMFTNEDKQKLVEMLSFCMGLHNENLLTDMVTTICIARELGKHLSLSEIELEILYYAAMLKNIVLVSMPNNLLDKKLKNGKSSTKTMQKHIDMSETIFKDKVDERICKLLVNQYEKSDGSGLPKGLKENQISLSQKILNVSSVMSIVINNNSYNGFTSFKMSSSEITLVIDRLIAEKKYSQVVLKTFKLKHEEILERVHIRQKERLKLYNVISDKYNKIIGNYNSSKNIYDS